MSKILEGLDKAVDQKIQNIISQNPKGSAAEQILLGKFLNSDQGAYARNVLGKNHKGWIEHITSWLKKYQPRLEKEFNELDFSDLTSLAYDMYENYLAKQGQLEEVSKAEIRANLDKDIKDFLNKGGEIEKLKPNRVRAIPGMGLASKHIGTAGEINRKTRSKMLVGKGRNIQGNKPVVNVEEGDIVSLHDEQKLLSRLIRDWWHGNEKQHAKATMMFAKMGYEPYEDGDEIVLAKGDDEVRFHMNDIIEGYSAGASGGAGLGEKINTPGGMGQSYRKHGSGPSGIKKKKTETAIPMFTPEDKMVNANDPGSDGWRVYSAKPSGILEGIITEYDTKTIDQVVERLPKGLTVNNFTIPAFKEYLYNKYYAVEKPNWKELVGHFAQEYRQKHGIKEYKLGDLNHFDNMLLALPKGLSAEQINLQGFKEFIYEKHGDKEWPEFKKNRFVYWDAYEKAGGSKKTSLFSKIKSSMGIDENLLNTYGDQLGLDEDVYTDSLYKEFLDSDYNKNQGSYIETLRNLGQFIRSKDMPEDKAKPIIRKLIAKLHPSGLNEEQLQLAELKCWAGYTRVRGVPAGAPGSCKKKTKESNIMKGLNNEEYLPHYTLGGKMYKSFTPADKLKNEPGSDTSDLENEANKEQLRRKMKEVLASLPERQQQVLILRFYKNKTLDQTAEIMDVSPERIRQLEIKALHRIKTYFRGLDSFILDKARNSENWLNSFFRYNPSRTDEYKEVDSQRKIEFSKENPPDLYYLYQQFIQRMLNPENTIDPNEWIDKVNKHYGLNYSWKDYQKRGHNDHTNNWQKIVDKYILKKSLNEFEQLDEGILQKMAGLALGTVLALGPKIGQADTVFSYLNPNTNQMQTAMDMSQVPATAKVVMAIDTDTNQVMMLKGGTAKNQEVKPDPAAIKQGQQMPRMIDIDGNPVADQSPTPSQKITQEPKNNQQPNNSAEIFANIQSGLTPDQIIQQNPNFSISKEKLTNIGSIGKISNFLGVNKTTVKAKGKLAGPYNVESGAYITFNNNKSDGVALEIPIRNLPKEWQDSGILGYNKGQAENLVKEIVKNAPQNLGSRVGKIKIRDTEGREIGGINIGYGTAAPTKSGVVGVGTSFNLFGSHIKEFVVTQDYENGRIVIPFSVTDEKYYQPIGSHLFGDVYMYIKDTNAPKDDFEVQFENLIKLK